MGGADGEEKEKQLFAVSKESDLTSPTKKKGTLEAGGEQKNSRGKGKSRRQPKSPGYLPTKKSQAGRQRRRRRKKKSGRSKNALRGESQLARMWKKKGKRVFVPGGSASEKPPFHAKRERVSFFMKERGVVPGWRKLTPETWKKKEGKKK